MTALAAGAVGLLGYSVSLTLFVLALRHLRTARTGAYFSTAPFVGAAVSLVIVRDSLSPGLLAAGVLPGIGVWLHLTERHEHQHEEMFHDYRHVHDVHHQHTHDGTELLGESPSYPHYHPPMRHSHPHYPDIHHRHNH